MICTNCDYCKANIELPCTSYYITQYEKIDYHRTIDFCHDCFIKNIGLNTMTTNILLWNNEPTKCLKCNKPILPLRNFIKIYSDSFAILSYGYYHQSCFEYMIGQEYTDFFKTHTEKI